jgi:hypothetical protein
MCTQDDDLNGGREMDVAKFHNGYWNNGCMTHFGGRKWFRRLFSQETDRQTSGLPWQLADLPNKETLWKVLA